jgi:hypothetical protein
MTKMINNKTPPQLSPWRGLSSTSVGTSQMRERGYEYLPLEMFEQKISKINP